MIIDRERLARASEFVAGLRGGERDGASEENILEQAFEFRKQHLYVNGAEMAGALRAAEDILFHRNCVAAALEQEVEKNLRFLARPDKLWNPSQRDSGPAGGLPDFSSPGWEGKIHRIQEYARAMPGSFFIVLIGNMVTEEALPNYKTVLDKIDSTGNLTGADTGPWAQWSCGWTAEEDRHGAVLRDYLSYSGRANMAAVDRSIFSLLRNGFDPRIGMDPYKLFIYTSFQERATRISHRNTGAVAGRLGDPVLESICTAIAGDESRHEAFYKNMMALIFERDPDGAMLAFEKLLRSQVVMPAELMEDGEPDLYRHFSLVAQKEGVYTTVDYVQIIEHLIDFWNVTARSVRGAAQRAQEYVCTLPERYRRTLVPKMEKALSRLEKRRYAWLHGQMV